LIGKEIFYHGIIGDIIFRHGGIYEKRQIEDEKKYGERHFGPSRKCIQVEKESWFGGRRYIHYLSG